MKQGDIVIIPFPFTDLSNSKIRPALVISNKIFNQYQNLMVVAISTQKGNQDFSIPLKQSQLDVGKLQKNSYIRLHNIFTIEKRLIIKTVAQANTSLVEQIKEKFIGFLE